MSKLPEVDAYLSNLTDWRGQQLSRFRELIHEVNPDIVEAWKWDVPVFVGRKSVLAISAFKEHVKMNFFQGAILDDLDHLFNNGLESKSNRSIDLKEGESIDEAALKRLIQSAFNLDQS